MSPRVESDEAQTQLVLVGGGHAHVQVLRRWRDRPLPNVQLTVLVDRPEAVYSGMVPGWIAGDYAMTELEIDVRALAERAGARVVLAPAVRIDAVKRCIELEGRAPVHYDVASLDVGSSVRGLSLPGVAEHAVATRPIGGFLSRLAEALDRPRRGAWQLRVAVVGGGVAGLEVAFTLEARLRAAGRGAEITVLAHPDILPESQGLARRMRRLAKERGIRVRTPFRVTHMDDRAVHADGERCVYDVAVLATGAAPQPVILASDLPKDDAGFVRVQPTLQVVGHEGLFAVGDCASPEGAPWVQKAGVYAVRMGPVLDHNLRARIAALELEGGAPGKRAGRARLRAYRPQRAFLALIHLGDRRALGTKWGLRLSGRWLWRLKDSIDRRFVRRFQVSEDGGDRLG